MAFFIERNINQEKKWKKKFKKDERSLRNWRFLSRAVLLYYNAKYKSRSFNITQYILYLVAFLREIFILRTRNKQIDIPVPTK